MLIGVVRYYGGTKLGVGGLISAYKTAAGEAIESGEVVVKHVMDRFELFFDYSEMVLIMDVIKDSKAQILEQRFENDCFLRIAIETPYTDQVLSGLDQFNALKIKKIGTY